MLCNGPMKLVSVTCIFPKTLVSVPMSVGHSGITPWLAINPKGALGQSRRCSGTVNSNKNPTTRPIKSKSLKGGPLQCL